MKKFQVFLSHSKHDLHGKDIAEGFRCWLHRNSALSSFLDVHDIPRGLRFSEVIEHHIANSVLVAIYTDSYSSREWCRREVLVAKRKSVPMVVVDCLCDGDERAFPYLGNTPVVRMDPAARDRFPQIAARLLDEVLGDLLWRFRVELLTPTDPATTLFMARPPELASLAALGLGRDGRRMIVHPDPPLGEEEKRLLAAAWQDVQIRTMTEWLAGGTS